MRIIIMMICVSLGFCGFEGAFLGIGLGGQHSTQTLGGDALASFNPSEKGRPHTRLGGHIKLLGGHSNRFDHWYIGGELFAIIPFHQNSTKREGTQFQGSTLYQRGWSLGLTPRLGFIIHNKVLLFTKFGLEISRDYMEWSNTGTLRPGYYEGRKKTLLGAIIGGGCEVCVSEHINLRLDYGYHSTRTLGDTLNNMTITLKRHAHMYNVALVYQF
jgi:opacity protein-like surface antigen